MNQSAGWPRRLPRGPRGRDDGVGGRQPTPPPSTLSRNKERARVVPRRLVIVSCCKISHSIYARLTAASKIHEGFGLCACARLCTVSRVIHLTLQRATCVASLYARRCNDGRRGENYVTALTASILPSFYARIYASAVNFRKAVTQWPDNSDVESRILGGLSV